MPRKKPNRKRQQQRPRPRKTQTVPMSPELAEGLEQQLEAFRKKFGREPGPGDPVFFDPDADEPKRLDPARMHRDVMEHLIQFGLAADKIYAYGKTGFLMDEDGWKNATKEAREEYEAALDEFFFKYGEPYPLHTGGFDNKGDGTPVFVLDGADTSEFMIDDKARLSQLVERMIVEKAWFMASPPSDNSESWTLYVQFPSAAVVDEILDQRDGLTLTRGLHTIGWDEGEDGDGCGRF